MKIERGSNVVPILASLFIFGGIFVDAVSYDHTAIIDCLAESLKPQYNGGIVVNPEINEGLKGWTTYGGVKIEPRVSNKGNNFIVAHSRTNPYGSVSQKVFLEKEKLHTFSVWIQVSGRGNIPVTALFKTNEGFKAAGSVIGQVGCWSMLKGGITVKSSGPAEFYFQSNDTSVDVWVDSISLQPFTQKEWRSHQHQSIKKVRKSKVRLQVVNSKGKPVPNANISIIQKKARFPFGASINHNIVNNAAYQKWFTSRFTIATFENEMKWYSTESTQGKEDYSQADAMLGFTSKHGISVRGHNIFWDDPQYQMAWENSLSPSDLLTATNKRLNSVVSRYAGKVIAWDVNNENLHFKYFEKKLGAKITDVFFQKTRQLDRHATLFMNDYNTIEDEGDGASSPSKYLQKIREISNFLGGRANLGIGVEGHFGVPNLPYVRSALDILAASKFPIWITELDVKTGPTQISDYEEILRELHSHRGVEGIVVWGPWSPQGQQCYNLCLVDPNFNNLPAGNVVDKLLKEWGKAVVVATTDAHGFFNTSLLHGDYHVKLLGHEHTLLDDNKQSSPFISHSFKVGPHSSRQTFKIIAQHSF